MTGVATALVFVLLAAAGALHGAPLQSPPQLEQAVEFLRAGRSREALGPLSSALAANPDGFDANYLTGLALAQLGRTREAITHLRKAQAANPKHIGALTLVGVLYLQADYPLDAAEALEAARSQGQAGEKPLLQLAEAWHRSYQFDRALAAAKEAAERYAQSPDARFRFGYELETVGRFEEARAELEKAVKLNPDFATANAALGRLEFREGRPDSARSFLEKALAKDAGLRQARLDMAKVLIAQKQLQPAKQLLDGLIAEADLEPEPHLLLSRIYRSSGDPGGAERERARFLELSVPSSPSGGNSGSGGMSSGMASLKVKRYADGAAKK